MTPWTTPVRLSDEAVIPLSTLDPAAPQDDLEWLDEAIGDARVVAIGESAHYNREFYRLRHRLLRYLVERHGFSAYAMESGFAEGWLTDNWVRAGDEAADQPNEPGRVMADGMTSLMGLWTQMRAHLTWMRRHNLTSSSTVGFYGIDLPGSGVSALPGLDAVIAYLAEADPGYDVAPTIRETALACAASSVFSAHAAHETYGKLAPESKDALTASLADLTARMKARRVDYLRRTGVDAYERALHSLGLTVNLDATLREQSRGTSHGMQFDIRDAAMADTVEWILRREDRIVVAAHNAHVQRCPVVLPGVPLSTTMGMQLAARRGADYLVIGTTSATGHTFNTSADLLTGKIFRELDAPRPGSLDALMAASHDGSFATDLRRLSPADARTVRTVTQQRVGADYADARPLDAFDIIVHLPSVSPAEPDEAALAHAPRDVRELFSRWIRE
ncbi:erythromycin esterase family protein [Streptomyces sp. NPDC006385]|uniref:erythromycin esterase family protein n=1 Tax=Streptomyces sp. NPDC006385 TaxID=3156761 RepID=UPI0033B9B3B9